MRKRTEVKDMSADKDTEATFPRWQKKRIFVRELAGGYDDLWQQLVNQPRVYKSKHKPFDEDSAIMAGKHMINPQETQVAQFVDCDIEVIGPGQYSQKHGHMNSAVMYVLEGKGHEIHDGVRYDWEAGDAILVGNARVHQHFNDSDTDPVRLVVLKAKPLFLFLSLLFQKNVTLPPTAPLPGFEDWRATD